MELPTIDPKDISEFHRLHGDFKDLQEQASAAILLAKENQDNELTIARDGKAIVVREKDLWDEIWALGPESEAGKVLSEKYADAFNLSADAEKKKGELKAFAQSKWNVDPLAMTLSDIIRIMEAVIEYKFQQRV